MTASGHSRPASKGRVLEGLVEMAEASDHHDSRAIEFAASAYDYDINRQLSTASTLEMFRTQIRTILGKMGFSHFTFSHLESAAQVEHQLLNVPSELLEDYRREAFFEADLILEYAKENTSPMYHSRADAFLADLPFETEFFRRNRYLFDMLRSHGFHDYFLMPANAVNGQGKVLFSVTTHDLDPIEFRALVEAQKPMLILLGRAIDRVATRKFSDALYRAVPKTKPDIQPQLLELLEVLAREDLTLTQAAHWLGRSVPTVNQQIAAIRRAFNVNTTIGALFEANRLGLISTNQQKASQQ